MRKGNIFIKAMFLTLLLGCHNSGKEKAIAKDSGRLQTIDPKDVLMTVPTIENAFPDFEKNSDTNNLNILEDDWRQLEFISKDQKRLIDEEIDSISYIFDHELHQGKDYYAFKRLYVRNLIPAPINLPSAHFLAALGNGNEKLTGVSVRNYNGQIKNGFSITLGGVYYYGRLDDGNNIVTLCIYAAESDEDLQNSIERLSKFLGTKNLYLVDWEHRTVLDEKNTQQLVALFENKM